MGNLRTTPFTAIGPSVIVLRVAICLVIPLSYGCEPRVVSAPSNTRCAVEAEGIRWDQVGGPSREGGGPLRAHRLCARSWEGAWRMEGVKGTLGRWSLKAKGARYHRERVKLRLVDFEIRGKGFVLRGDRLDVDTQNLRYQGHRVSGTLWLPGDIPPSPSHPTSTGEEPLSEKEQNVGGGVAPSEADTSCRSPHSGARP